MIRARKDEGSAASSLWATSLCADYGAEMILTRDVNVKPSITAQTQCSWPPAILLSATPAKVMLGEQSAPAISEGYPHAVDSASEEEKLFMFRTCFEAKIKAPMVISDLIQKFQAVMINQ